MDSRNYKSSASVVAKYDPTLTHGLLDYKWNINYKFMIRVTGLGPFSRFVRFPHVCDCFRVVFMRILMVLWRRIGHE